MRQAAKYYVVSVKTQPFSPLDLSPALWLDASDTTTITESSGAVSEWRDKSGNARHVSQGTAAKQPTTGATTQNGLNVISFDGSADSLFRSTFTVTQPFTVVAMFKWASTTNNFRLFSFSNAVQLFIDGSNREILYAGGSAVLNPATDTSAHCVEYVFNGASSARYTDGASNGGGNAGTDGSTASVFRLAARADDSLYGAFSMFELLVVPGTLSAGDRLNIVSYCQSKWGTP